MKRAIAKILILAIALFAKKSDCQNLVKNYSFEDMILCPATICDIDSHVKHWHNPTDCSPDYYNECAPTIGCNVPNVANSGYQYARTGNALCGFYGYDSLNMDAREYIQGELTDTLQFSKKYCVSFYVNLMEFSRYGITNLGAYFSSSLINMNVSCKNLPFIPQIENIVSNQLIDTMGWTLISGEFVASGTEKYITIGNFRDNNNTNIILFNPTPIMTAAVAYYLIDDVSVICCDCEDTSNNNNLFIPNAFSPNNDGHNDVLRVLGNAKKVEFKVFDRWGEMVYSYTGGEMGAGTGWDGTYKGKALDNAVFVYFAKVTLPDGKEVGLKGNVSLIK
jgi:gliding motility-associated-like protein